MATVEQTFLVDAQRDEANVRANVKTLLGWRTMTRADLAAALGWDESMVSRRLNGKTALSARDVAAFARVLRVSPGTLYTDPELLINSRWEPETPGYRLHPDQQRLGFPLPARNLHTPADAYAA